MTTIKPIIQYVESFIVTGFCIRTKNSDEIQSTAAKIPALWQQFYSSHLSQYTPAYGVYSNYESDASSFYTLTVGVSKEHNEITSDEVIIKAGNYLVFSDKGPMPVTVINLWKKIWNYFEDNVSQQRHFMTDFEVYHGDEKVTIYIGIK